MAIEEVMERLTAALDRNTEALGGAKAPKGAATAAASKPATGTAAKVTIEEVKAAIMEVKAKFNRAACLKIIKDVGGASEIAQIKSAKFGAVIAACKEKLEPADDAEEEAPEDDDEM